MRAEDGPHWKPEPEERTVTITFSLSQVGLVVVGLLELSKRANSTADQVSLSRLAIGLNDLLSEEENAEPESR
jgi:hypothetical protein